MGQFAKLAQDEARDKKKLAKKEQLERSKEDLSKVRVFASLVRNQFNSKIFVPGFLYFGCEGDFVLFARGRSLG